MARIGRLGRLGRIEVDVDYVVQRPHRHTDRLAQLRQIQRAVRLEVGVEDDRAKVAHCRLVLAGVEGDLRAKVGAVNHPRVVLRTTHIARVLEGDPRVACLKQHRQHPLPNLDRWDLLTPDLAAVCLLFVGQIRLLKLLAVAVVQIRHLAGAEERPVLPGLHPLHEKVGDPVGRVHVVATTTVVPGVFPQLEEIKQVVVPGLQVRTAGALSFPTLVHCHQQVIVQLQERNHPLAFSVGAANIAAGPAYARPRAAQATRPFGEHRVLRHAPLHDPVDRIVDPVQVAGGELAVVGAGVEKRWRRGAEPAALVEVVQLDRPLFPVLGLGVEQSHRDPHPEELGRLQAAAHRRLLVDDQIAVIQRLYAQEIKLQVRQRVERRRHLVDVVLKQILAKAADRDPAVDRLPETATVKVPQRPHPVPHDVPAQHLLVNERELDPAGKLCEIRILFDQGLGVEADRVV